MKKKPSKEAAPKDSPKKNRNPFSLRIYGESLLTPATRMWTSGTNIIIPHPIDHRRWGVGLCRIAFRAIPVEPYCRSHLWHFNNNGVMGD